jgi:hypothetical protein
VELGKLEHFCRGTMQTGQYKSTLFFKYLKKLHECTDSGAVELGEFLQIEDKIFESPLDISIDEATEVRRVIYILLTGKIDDNGIFFISTVDIVFPHQPKYLFMNLFHRKILFKLIGD